MYKKIYQYLGIVGIALLVFVASLSIVSAGSFTVSKSKSTVEPGGTFTVTVTAKSAAGQFKATVSNGSGGSTFWLDNSSKTLTIKAGTSGTVKVTVDAIDVTDANDDSLSVKGSKSVSVTIKSKTTTNNNNSNNNNSNNNNTNNNNTNNNNNNNTNNNNNNTTTQTNEEEKSKINTLSSLSVDQGTLSPKFSENTTSYDVNVDAKVTSINISAKAKDSKAKVSGVGKKTLEAGENTFVVKCTAENGNVKSYTLNVKVDETPLVYTEYNGQKLGVVRNLKNIGIPDSFEETTSKIGDDEVTVYHSNLMDKTIIYLSNDKNEKNFYLFEDGKVTSVFIPITILGRNVYQIDLTGNEINSQNMTFKELSIDNNTLMGWTYNDPQYANYSLIMVMNEKGEIVTYQYEKTEDSLQLYIEPIQQEETSDNDALLKTIFIVISGILAIVCIGLIIYIHRFKKKSIAVIKEYFERRNQ